MKEILDFNLKGFELPKDIPKDFDYRENLAIQLKAYEKYICEHLNKYPEVANSVKENICLINNCTTRNINVITRLCK